MKKIAGIIPEKDMDKSVRIQDDLFKYVNGTWLIEHQISPDRSREGVFTILLDKSENDIHEIIKDTVKKVNDGFKDEKSKKIALIYSKFMDEEAVNKHGVCALEKLINEIKTSQTKKDLIKLMAKNSILGVSSLFNFDVENDLNNPEKNILFMGQGGLGLPDESFYTQEHYKPICKKYVEHISNMLRLYGLEDKSKEIFLFEEKIAKCHWDAVKLRQAELMNNPMTWDNFISNMKNFPWEEWKENLGVTYEAFKNIICTTPSFFTDVVKVYEQENVEIIKLWLCWNILHSYAPYLSKEYVDENFNFYGKILSGTDQIRPRWKRAVALVESCVPDLLGKKYVEKHFPEENKNKMEELVNNLLEAYRVSIENLDWMTDETKRKALEKLETFSYKIGYQNKWKDYKDLVLDDVSLIEIIQRCTKYECEYIFSQAGKEIDKDKWHMTPQTVNAYYHPMMNEIVFPAAILQPPFFDMNADDATNYGAIGAVIGHEIGHGFDDQGSKYDCNGALNNWWKQEDRDKFEAKADKLVQQYSACVPMQLKDMKDADKNYHVNGQLTLGENIGDLGGLSIALKAYKIAQKKKNIDPKLEIIDGFNGIQRIFLSWANIWKGKNRKEDAIKLLSIDPHSPNEFRCNQIVKNIDEFVNEFKVKDTDKLWISPEDRVKIW